MRKDAESELHNPKTGEVARTQRGTKARVKKLKEAVGEPWQFRRARR